MASTTTILFTWVGKTDLNAATKSDYTGLGPVAQAATSRKFNEIVLFSNYPKQELTPYLRWLKSQTSTTVTLHIKALSSPTHFGEIYHAVLSVLSEVTKKQGEELHRVFHLSPGTPAMAAVWIILAKTQFPAELIESSKEQGVKTTSFPFEISAEFIPELLKKSDSRLCTVSQARPPEFAKFGDIFFRSPEMSRVISRAQKLVLRTIPVLIEGESGTGKELLARAIHYEGPRRDKPFIAVNCGAISQDLIESELFGHEKGAFSGAFQKRIGAFEAANEGTIFLDEIGEFPKMAQVKLLRVLQENEVTRVGSSKFIPINVRVIAATNRSMMEEVASGNFREDLFYRLAVAVIHIPPLRERRGELALLIDRLLDQINKESDNELSYKPRELTPSAKNALLNHHWPGNVRELLNTLRRAAVWSDAVKISDQEIKDSLLLPIEKKISLNSVNDETPPDDLNLNKKIAQVATRYIAFALEKTHGNKTQAAKLLGFNSHQTLTSWLKKM